MGFRRVGRYRPELPGGVRTETRRHPPKLARVWVFDTEHRRFRRIVKGLLSGEQMATDWRPYKELEIDPESDAFVVVLGDASTPKLRSWRHNEAVCLLCGATGTEELSPEELTVIEGG